MSLYQTTPLDSEPFERPTCANCGSSMWISRITSARPDIDKRAWECPVCDISERAVVNFN
jgi:hypothetical protein